MGAAEQQGNKVQRRGEGVVEERRRHVQATPALGILAGSGGDFCQARGAVGGAFAMQGGGGVGWGGGG